MGNDAAIPDTHKAPMLLTSIDPNCALESTAAALRTNEVTELTWDYVATTMIDDYNDKQSSVLTSGRISRSKNSRNESDKGGRRNFTRV